MQTPEITPRLELATDEGRRDTYIIENGGSPQPIWLRVTVSVDDYDDIEVVAIELYATRAAALTEDLSRFIAEDVWETFDESARKAIYAEMDRQDGVRRDQRRIEAQARMAVAL